MPGLSSLTARFFTALPALLLALAFSAVSRARAADAVSAPTPTLRQAAQALAGLRASGGNDADALDRDSLAALTALAPPQPALEEARREDRVRQVMSAARQTLHDQFVASLADTYAVHLPRAEIDELLRFYRSDAGQRYLAFDAELEAAVGAGLGTLWLGGVPESALDAQQLRSRSALLGLSETLRQLRAGPPSLDSRTEKYYTDTVTFLAGAQLDPLAARYGTLLDTFAAFLQSRAVVDEQKLFTQWASQHSELYVSTAQQVQRALFPARPESKDPTDSTAPPIEERNLPALRQAAKELVLSHPMNWLQKTHIDGVETANIQMLASMNLVRIDPHATLSKDARIKLYTRVFTDTALFMLRTQQAIRDKAVASLGDYYATHLPPEEIDALRHYYRSSAGQRYQAFGIELDLVIGIAMEGTWRVGDAPVLGAGLHNARATLLALSESRRLGKLESRIRFPEMEDGNNPLADDINRRMTEDLLRAAGGQLDLLASRYGALLANFVSFQASRASQDENQAFARWSATRADSDLQSQDQDKAGMDTLHSQWRALAEQLRNAEKH